MRRRSLLLAVPAGLLTLSACGDEKSDQDKDQAAESPSAPEPGASAKIVDGPLPAITDGAKFGEKPTVAKGSGKPSTDLAVKTVIAGSGTAVAEGDYVRAHYLGQIWDTAKVFDNSYDRKQPLVIQLQQGGVIDGWRLGLAGKKTKSRVEMAVPPALGYGSEGRGDIKGTDTMVFVIDIEETFNGRALRQGQGGPAGRRGPPEGRDEHGRQGTRRHRPEGRRPEEARREVRPGGRRRGGAADRQAAAPVQGRAVERRQGVRLQLLPPAARRLPARTAHQGLAGGLAGKKVGSRVMLVVPPDKGYGNQASGEIPANSTLVFTLDILAKM